MSSFEKVAAIFVTGVVGIAVLNVLVRSSSKTPQVINATGGALSGSLTAAEGK